MKNSKSLFGQDNMKPMMILPPGSLSQNDIKKLNDNGICTVVSKNPERLKFVDPIPSISQRTRMEDAAIKLSRRILNRGCNLYDTYAKTDHREILNLYIRILVEGTTLDPEGTKEEQEQRIFDSEREDELRRLARIDAKKLHEKRKAAKAKREAKLANPEIQSTGEQK